MKFSFHSNRREISDFTATDSQGCRKDRDINKARFPSSSQIDRESSIWLNKERYEGWVLLLLRSAHVPGIIKSARRRLLAPFELIDIDGSKHPAQSLPPRFIRLTARREKMAERFRGRGGRELIFNAKDHRRTRRKSRKLFS